MNAHIGFSIPISIVIWPAEYEIQRRVNGASICINCAWTDESDPLVFRLIIKRDTYQ